MCLTRFLCGDIFHHMTARARKTAVDHTEDPQAGPWLTLAEVSTRLRFKSRFGIYSWLKANDVKRVRRGRAWLVAKRDVDAALTRGAEE
jgi:Helix-turn-helix domain